MAVPIYIPDGPLRSWGPFTFVVGRSVLLDGWTIAPQVTTVTAAGQQFVADRMGLSLLPVEMRLTWEYLVRMVAGDFDSLQTELNALTAAMASAQVHTLAVDEKGPGGTQRSGLARLTNISQGSSGGTWKKLHLEFFLPQGFS